MCQSESLAGLCPSLIADVDFASCDMGPHGATESLEVGQGNAGVTQSGRLTDKFLGMAGTVEKAVIAGDCDLAPASRGCMRCTTDRCMRP